MVVTVTRSLEDLLYETREEFARRLGMMAQTYRRLLARDPAIATPTRRQIAARLSIPPHMIAEFVPPPTPERMAAAFSECPMT